MRLAAASSPTSLKDMDRGTKMLSAVTETGVAFRLRRKGRPFTAALNLSELVALGTSGSEGPAVSPLSGGAAALRLQL